MELDDKRSMGRSRWKAAGALLLMAAIVLASGGCTAYRAFRKGGAAETREDFDRAVLEYIEAISAEPDNIRYKISLQRAKMRASQAHFERGKRFTLSGRQDLAVIEYQQAVQLDPTNQYSAVELREALEDLQKLRASDSERVELLKAKTRGAKAQPPQLNPRSEEPINLSFPKPTNTKDIYKALGAAAGVNILFDQQLKDEKITVEIKNMSLRNALETIMRTATHFYKVLDPESIIVAADNAQNRRTYEDLVIRTFFLSNADAKDVLNVIRTLIDARKIAIIPQLNALVLRDTADKVAVAERIIEANDKALSEVVIDVELLQVDSSKAQELGLQLSNYNVSQSLNVGGTSTAPAPLRLSDFEFINQANWILTIPNILYHFFKSASDAELLARPQLRISEGQKASLHIGDKVPIPTTTFNTTQTVGGSIIPITSFQYQDVGIKIEVEPRVHYNKEITMKLTVEVSNLSGSVSGSGGVSQPIIGTRNITTTIRLRDGETNLLAGLYRNDSSNEQTGIPWLSDLPVLGRLFSKTKKTSKNSDVVLTMTPHIIRVPNITEEDLLPIWVGTENNITFQGGRPIVESPVEDSPLETPQEGSLPEDKRGGRVVPFPRGVSPQEGEGQPPGGRGSPRQLPPGGGLPSDPFRKENPPPPGEPQKKPFAELAPSWNSLPGDPLPPSSAEAPPPPEFTSSAAGLNGDRLGSADLVADTNFVQGFPPAGIGSPTVGFVPAFSNPIVGESFEVGVQIDNAEGVAYVPLTLNFDPRVMRLEEVRKGGFMDPDGAAVLLSEIDNERGEARLAVSRLGAGRPVAGSGLVVFLRFSAVGPGNTEIGFASASLWGADAREIQANFVPGHVVVP